MIDRQALLKDLQTLLERLEADLLERSESAEVPDVGRTLRAEYERAKQAERTAANYEDWRSDAITQAAAAWVLSCVFVRFLEDNHLIEPPKISGQTSVVRGQWSVVSGRGENRLQRARDEHELFFRAHPKLTDRDYILAVFDELAALPGTHEVFGEHNPIRELPNWLSGDAGGELLRFFQKIDANTGALVHDFTRRMDFQVRPDGTAGTSNADGPGGPSYLGDGPGGPSYGPSYGEDDTRFLGDLYQDLSAAARKKYALLQTPEFVEEFILERTLEPALNEFGLCPSSVVSCPLSVATDNGQRTTEIFRMIDPACGSGHFLLGSFRRILERWRKQDPKAKPRDLIQRTLDSIHGVDVNPYAVAIARFRLLLMAMQAEGIKRLADAPAYRIHLAVGDSLMHGRPGGDQLSLGWRDVDHVYHAEDRPALQRLLAAARYHAVVANPPYITPKDSALNEEYRHRYPKVCHMKYSLAVPFMQRLFDLACSGGFTGQITANSFMKREFGKKLVEDFLPKVDLTHVIDTQCVHLPGHGTSTVILFGRQRPPVCKDIRLVSTLKNEEPKPAIPEQGKVWLAVVEQVDCAGSQGEFVSVNDTARAQFGQHPWSIGGGGAAELKEWLDEQREKTLGEIADSIGVMAIAGDDEVFVDQSLRVWKRRDISQHWVRLFITGDDVRDWAHTSRDHCMFPYDPSGKPFATPPQRETWFLWAYRTTISAGIYFGQRKDARGLKWFEYAIVMRDRVTASSLIHFVAVATHNHFVLKRDSAVCNRHSPVIKLPAGATEDDHLALLGLLNSSTACFWMKQVFQDKGGGGIGGGISAEPWERRFEHDGTKLKRFPVPAVFPLTLARRLDVLARNLSRRSPASVVEEGVPTSATLTEARREASAIRTQMIAIQEELDWECYSSYGVLEGELSCKNPPAIQLGQRAFEIVIGRRMALGEFRTTWFDRHGSVPITELPAEWPEEYKRLVRRRIELIETDRNIGLIEQPGYKRRWNTEPWESQLEQALREWLLGQLESYFDFDGRMSDARRPTAKLDIALTSVARLADVARQDAAFMQVGEVYRDDRAFSVDRLVAELVEVESVPLLPVLRYKPGGLRKRAEWEQTWELQREEDRSMSVVSSPLSVVEDNEQRAMDHGPRTTDIPVPPKYINADFLKSDYWRLRGKLDVPKERWVSFPHCEGPDGTLVIAWAGYDHLQLARAISAYFVDIQDRLGGRDDPRLIPLLACLQELLPWLNQWHNGVDPEFGERMGDYFHGYVNEEARQLGKTIPEIKAWEPPQKKGGRKKK